MRAGATFIDPASVTLAFDTALGEDVTIEPCVFFGPGVAVGRGALIRAFSHLEGARIGENAQVGPFARLRPGATLMQDVRIGNFVEVKASTVGKGAKINHLSYIGNAAIGAKTNVGAGTITCNYDGFGKFETVIGDGVFVGSHSARWSRRSTIGDGAYIGTGSVITRDVAARFARAARASISSKSPAGRRISRPEQEEEIGVLGEALQSTCRSAERARSGDQRTEQERSCAALSAFWGRVPSRGFFSTR